MTNTIVCRDGELVRFENVTVHRGRNAIRVEGDGHAEIVNCAFYEQAEETFAVERGTLYALGGIAYTPFLCRGSGNVFLDAFWFSALPDHADIGYRNRSYAAIDVGTGGRLVLRDLLGVPCYFRLVMPMHEMWRVPPEPDQLGDFRWIDSSGDVECHDCRFGGEWGWLTPVYQHGPGTTYVEGPYFATDCPRLRSTKAVVCIDSPAEPVIVDSVTLQHAHPFAEQTFNTYPHRHDPP